MSVGRPHLLISMPVAAIHEKSKIFVEITFTKYTPDCVLIYRIFHSFFFICSLLLFSSLFASACPLYCNYIYGFFPPYLRYNHYIDISVI